MQAASYHITTLRHNPEDLDLNHHRNESLKTRNLPLSVGQFANEFVQQ
jgi:hypothetical protein